MFIMVCQGTTMLISCVATIWFRASNADIYFVTVLGPFLNKDDTILYFVGVRTTLAALMRGGCGILHQWQRGCTGVSWGHHGVLGSLLTEQQTERCANIHRHHHHHHHYHHLWARITHMNASLSCWGPGGPSALINSSKHIIHTMFYLLYDSSSF